MPQLSLEKQLIAHNATQWYK